MSFNSPHRSSGAALAQCAYWHFSSHRRHGAVDVTIGMWLLRHLALLQSKCQQVVIFLSRCPSFVSDILCYAHQLLVFLIWSWRLHIPWNISCSRHLPPAVIMRLVGKVLLRCLGPSLASPTCKSSCSGAWWPVELVEWDHVGLCLMSTFVFIVTLLMMLSKAYSAAAVECSRVCVGTTTQKAVQGILSWGLGDLQRVWPDLRGSNWAGGWSGCCCCPHQTGPEAMLIALTLSFGCQVLQCKVWR